jgi:hypothetical protein
MNHPHGMVVTNKEVSMQNGLKLNWMWIFFWLVALVGTSILSVAAAADRDMQGWGVDDPYNGYYDVREYEKFRAWVVKMTEVVPLPGMSPATAMIVRDGSEMIEVHLCPTWFAGPGDVGVKPGDRVKIKGAWAEIDGKDVFMASKVKKGDYFEFKVRLTGDGTPFWTLSPEQLAHEQEESRKSVMVAE